MYMHQDDQKVFDDWLIHLDSSTSASGSGDPDPADGSIPAGGQMPKRMVMNAIGIRTKMEDDSSDEAYSLTSDEPTPVYRGLASEGTIFVVFLRRLLMRRSVVVVASMVANIRPRRYYFTLAQSILRANKEVKSECLSA